MQIEARVKPFGGKFNAVPQTPHNSAECLYFPEGKNVVVRAKKGYTLEDLTLGLELTSELQDGYGILVPKYRIVPNNLPETKGKSSHIAVAQKIEGTALLQADIDPENPAHFKMAQEVSGGIAKYALNVYKSGSVYLNDLGPEQFVLGRRRTDKEEKLYLVDVEPRMGQFESAESKSNTEVCLLLETLGRNAVDLIVFFESKFGLESMIDARHALSVLGDLVRNERPGAMQHAQNHLMRVARYLKAKNLV